MFYKFDVNGIYCGTSKTEVSYSTNVAPPSTDNEKTWVWNHVNWVAMPSGWKPIQHEYTSVTVEPPVEVPSEETPPTE